MELGSGLVGISDFSCVGQIADHVDLEKLSIAVMEAEEFDIRPLVGRSQWVKLKSLIRYVKREYVARGIENEADPGYLVVLGGQCWSKGVQWEIVGILRVLVYFGYSRYLLINEFNDTPSGNVSKANSFSIPKPLRELKDFANKYRDMAMESWRSVGEVICLNKGHLGIDIDCDSVGIGAAKKVKGHGVRCRHVKRFY